MKTVTIDLRRNTMTHDEVFELENLATILTIDFTGMGVDGWEKFLDYKNAKGEKGQIVLGKETVTTYNIPNTLMEMGALSLNPIAKRLEKDGETVRQQAFKTFKLDIQSTVNTYGEGSNNKDDIILPMRKDIKDLQMWRVTTDKHQDIQDVRLDSIEANDVKVNKWITEHEGNFSKLSNRVATAEGKLIKHERTLEEHTEDIEWLKKNGGGSGSGGNMTPEQVIQLDKATSDNKRQDEEIKGLGDDFTDLLSKIGEDNSNKSFLTTFYRPREDNLSIELKYGVFLSPIKGGTLNKDLSKGNNPFTLGIDGSITYEGEEPVVSVFSFGTAVGVKDMIGTLDYTFLKNGKQLYQRQFTPMKSTVSSNTGSMLVYLEKGDKMEYFLSMSGGNTHLTMWYGATIQIAGIPTSSIGSDIPNNLRKRLESLEEGQTHIDIELSRLFGDNKIPLEAQSMSRDTWSYDGGIDTVVEDQRVPAFDDYPMTHVKGKTDSFKLIAGYLFKRGVLEKDIPYQCTVFVSNKSNNRLAISLSGVDIKGYEYVEPNTTRTVIINSKGLGFLIPQLSFHADGEVDFYAGGISVRKNRLLAEMTQETREVKALADANEQKIGAVNGIAMTNRGEIAKLNSFVKTTYIRAGQDLNLLTTPGYYTSDSLVIAESLKNCPTKEAFVLEVLERNSGNVVQRLTEYTSENVYLRGASSGNLGSWKYVSLPVESGFVNITPNTAAGANWYKGTLDVKFKNPFRKPPLMTVSCRTSDPHLVFASFHGVTETGFTITYVRPNQSAGQVDWIATASDKWVA